MDSFEKARGWVEDRSINPTVQGSKGPRSKGLRVQGSEGPRIQGSKGEGKSERKVWSRLLDQAGGVQPFSSFVPEALSPMPH